MSAPRRIAVVVSSSAQYGRELLHGIADFTRGNPGWQFVRDPWTLIDHRGASLSEPVDGVLALEPRGFSPGIHVAPATPWVIVADVHEGPGPRVMAHNVAVGRLAAEHVLACGLRNFAYCGYPEVLYSAQRLAGFRETIEAEGYQVATYPLPDRPESEWDGPAERRRIARWLLTLPLPVGLLAARDVRAASVQAACLLSELRVPQDVALVGVDNDELVCEFTTPRLTSVDPNARRVGFEGATLLAGLLEGTAPLEELRLIEPRALVRRESSDTFAAEDPLVAEAFMYLRRNACQGITVQDVLRAVPVARRTFEKAARKVLGHSPLHEIRRVQIARASQLLSDTDVAIAEVARLSGLGDGKYLAEVFRKQLGTTPSAFRRASRTHG